jgi:hypothetical protein
MKMSNSHHKMTDYEVLKQAGHPAAKAAEIVLDAKRGDPFARQWIKILQQQFGQMENEND